MTVEVLAPGQVQSLADHIGKTESLSAATVEAIQQLAQQLDGRPVVPLLGAGASYDCGVRLAGDIGRDLYRDYQDNPRYDPHQTVSSPSALSEIAQAIFNFDDQATAVRAIRLHETAAWPSAEMIEDHFCAYRILARMARERMVKQTIGFNYDCHNEAGLDFEGFERSPYTSSGHQWTDHAKVVTDKLTNDALDGEGDYLLYKAHGCAARYRELAVSDEEAAAETIVLRQDQLNIWRTDNWMRDAFRTVARRNVLLFLGFAGGDPVIAGEVTRTLSDVYRESSSAGYPRVVVLDPNPNSAQLGAAVQAGLNREPLAAGLVSRVDTERATTASLLCLLTEWLALRLEETFAANSYRLPAGRSARVTALAVTAPLIARWSYLLKPSGSNPFMQHVNVQRAAERGYVPLQAVPERIASALRIRAELRATFGRTGDESATEALRHDGFVVAGGQAYLPVGLGHEEVLSACQPGGTIDHARAALPHPGIDVILVSDARTPDRGVSIHTGETVSVP